MNRIVIPETYRPALGGYDLQCAIGYIKHGFQAELERSLRLKRVSAPLFVSADSGLNDDLSGTERPVAFDIPAIGKGTPLPNGSGWRSKSTAFRCTKGCMPT